MITFQWLELYLEALDYFKIQVSFSSTGNENRERKNEVSEVSTNESIPSNEVTEEDTVQDVPQLVCKV